MKHWYFMCASRIQCFAVRETQALARRCGRLTPTQDKPRRHAGRHLGRGADRGATTGPGAVPDRAGRAGGRQFPADPEIRNRRKPYIGLAPASDRYGAGHRAGRFLSCDRTFGLSLCRRPGEPGTKPAFVSRRTVDRGLSPPTPTQGPAGSGRAGRGAGRSGRAASLTYGGAA